LLPSSDDLIRRVEESRGQRTRDLASSLGVTGEEYDDFVALMLRLQSDGSIIRVPEGGWDIPEVARFELIDVTAIEPQSDPGLARVVYTWRWIPTAGGRAFGRTDAPRESRVTFRRNQTGWRMSTVRENRGRIGG